MLHADFGKLQDVGQTRDGSNAVWIQTTNANGERNYIHLKKSEIKQLRKELKKFQPKEGL